MRRYVINYLKTCVECQRYKPDNLKPMGLLQTPVPAQHFEVVAVDVFGPLPKGPKRERWVMIVEDTASKWIELFSLAVATAEACAKVLIEKDKSRRDDTLIAGDLVLMKPHVLSSNAKGASSKFVPKRDDPYLINKKVSPTTYLLAYPETLDEPIGKYHDSDLKRYHAREDACSEILEPVVPKRRRDDEDLDNDALGDYDNTVPIVIVRTYEIYTDFPAKPENMQGVPGTSTSKKLRLPKKSKNEFQTGKKNIQFIQISK
ncbi:hypothetical protein EVAR_22553_1 [Eumeta japonica]|uniref:Tf2-1-like SH3-like domain-containing protein n=1 Tax=Eumeta variegata TaxID=151549 RepID=A0A4C1U833_EUMVA|nr:hypothetical protein EVAR_22553_1 [Eumeta japonica]